jgi:hypothetical protein
MKERPFTPLPAAKYIKNGALPHIEGAAENRKLNSEETAYESPRLFNAWMAALEVVPQFVAAPEVPFVTEPGWSRWAKFTAGEYDYRVDHIYFDENAQDLLIERSKAEAKESEKERLAISKDVYVSPTNDEFYNIRFQVGLAPASGDDTYAVTQAEAMLKPILFQQQLPPSKPS